MQLELSYSTPHAGINILIFRNIILARYWCMWADTDTDTEFELSLLIRVLPNSAWVHLTLLVLAH